MKQKAKRVLSMLLVLIMCHSISKYRKKVNPLDTKKASRLLWMPDF